jgi:hypothetical protein
LISIKNENAIIVWGVIEKHPSLNWKRGYGDDPNVPQTIPKRVYNRIEENRIEKSRVQTSPEILKIKEKISMSEFVDAVNQSRNDDWVASLITKFGIEKVEAGLDSMFDYYAQKGIPPPNRGNIRPKIWQWIERQKDKDGADDKIRAAFEA